MLPWGEQRAERAWRGRVLTIGGWALRVLSTGAGLVSFLRLRGGLIGGRTHSEGLGSWLGEGALALVFGLDLLLFERSRVLLVRGRFVRFDPTLLRRAAPWRLRRLVRREPAPVLAGLTALPRRWPSRKPVARDDDPSE